MTVVCAHTPCKPVHLLFSRQSMIFSNHLPHTWQLPAYYILDLIDGLIAYTSCTDAPNACVQRPARLLRSPSEQQCDVLVCLLWHTSAFLPIQVAFCVTSHHRHQPIESPLSYYKHTHTERFNFSSHWCFGKLVYYVSFSHPQTYTQKPHNAIRLINPMQTSARIPWNIHNHLLL